MSNKLFTYELRDSIALIGINRTHKRNALHHTMFGQLNDLALRAADEAAVGIIHGHGDHFCAGLDLAEVLASLESGERPSIVDRTASNAFHNINRGRIPFIAALTGAVIGAGLETACSAHIRVADQTAFFGLPEAKRGIFVGAGGSVRIQRALGNARMTDMMLTGRTLNAAEAELYNLIQYRVPAGQALDKALELAVLVAANTRESNWAITQGLSRVNDMSHDDAMFVETLVANATVSAGSSGRLDDFLSKRTARLTAPTDASA